MKKVIVLLFCCMMAAFAVEIPADLMCAMTPGAQFVMYNNAPKIQNSVFGKEFMKIALEFLEKPTVQAMFKASGNNMAELKEALKKQEQEKIDLMLGSLKLAVKDGNIEEPDKENTRFCFILRSTQKLDVDAEMKDAMKSFENNKEAVITETTFEGLKGFSVKSKKETDDQLKDLTLLVLFANDGRYAYISTPTGMKEMLARQKSGTGSELRPFFAGIKGDCFFAYENVSPFREAFQKKAGEGDETDSNAAMMRPFLNAEGLYIAADFTDTAKLGVNIVMATEEDATGIRGMWNMMAAPQIQQFAPMAKEQTGTDILSTVKLTSIGKRLRLQATITLDDVKNGLAKLEETLNKGAEEED